MSALLVRATAVLALLLLLFALEQYVEGRGYDRAMAETEAALNQQKADAARLLASEIQRTHAAQDALQAFKNQQELKDANHQKTIADLSDRLRRLADHAGRLRDPYATGCGGGGGGPTAAASPASGDRPADQPDAGGLLSAELSGLLQRLTREADDINAAYTSCRADAFAVRQPP